MTDIVTPIVDNLAPVVADLLPFNVEIHCTNDPDLPRKLGAKIRETGGDYTEARGHTHKRYVSLPNTARDLIDEVVRTYGMTERQQVWVKGRLLPVGCVTMIVRPSAEHGDPPAPLAVAHIPPRTASPIAKLERWWAHGILRARDPSSLLRDRAERVLLTRAEKVERAAQAEREALAAQMRAGREADDVVAMLSQVDDAWMRETLLRDPGLRCALLHALKDAGADVAAQLRAES